MRILRNITLFFVVLAVVLIGICTGVMRVHAGSRPGDSTGRNFVSETRAVGAEVVNVEMDGPVDVMLRQGPVARIEVRAEQRMLPKITTVQQGDTLRIDTHGLVLGSTRPMRVIVTLPGLQKLIQRGSGDASVRGFTGEQIELVMNGSGDMQMGGQFRQIGAHVHGSGDLQLEAGSTDKLALELLGSGNASASGTSSVSAFSVSGSGDLDAGELDSDRVTFRGTGSGNSVVHARQSIAVSLRGSGDVAVRGEPRQREVNSSGSGEVSFE